MKKLFTSIFIFLSVLLNAQINTPPTGSNFKTLPTYSFKWYTPDSTLWMYKGSTYGWTNISKGLDSLQYYRLLNNHDSLSTLQEKSYSSLDDKPDLSIYAPIDNPTFTGTVTTPSLIVTDLTDGYLPYQLAADDKLSNSNIYYDGTNVGVATTTVDTYKFNVNGSLNATSIYVNGSLLTPGSGSNWTVSGSNIYRSSGKVSIGTTTATQLVTLGVGGQSIQWLSTAAQADSRSIGIRNDGTHWGDFEILGSNANDDVLDVTRLIINKDGNMVIGGSTTAGVRFVNMGATASAGPTLGSGTVGAQAILSTAGLYGLYTGLSATGDAWMQVQRNDADATAYNLLLNPAGGKVVVGGGAVAVSVPFNVFGTVAIRTLTTGAEGITIAPQSGAKLIYSDYWTGSEQALVLGTFTNRANQVYMTTTGRVGIMTASPSTVLDVNGVITATSGNSTNWNTAYTHSQDNTQAHSDYLLNNANDATSGTLTATNFILSSDKRLKTNITPIKKKTFNIKFVQFNPKDDPNQLRYGAIAQDVEKYYPELVRTDTSGMKSIAYIDLLIGKIHELEQRIEKLEKSTKRRKHNEN